MKELVLSTPLYPGDFLLAHSSRCRGGQLSLECLMMSAHSRYGLSFDGSAQTLHCFFDFR